MNSLLLSPVYLVFFIHTPHFILNHTWFSNISLLGFLLHSIYYFLTNLRPFLSLCLDFWWIFYHFLSNFSNIFLIHCVTLFHKLFYMHLAFVVHSYTHRKCTRVDKIRTKKNESVWFGFPLTILSGSFLTCFKDWSGCAHSIPLGRTKQERIVLLKKNLFFYFCLHRLAPLQEVSSLAVFTFPDVSLEFLKSSNLVACMRQINVRKGLEVVQS